MAKKDAQPLLRWGMWWGVTGLRTRKQGEALFGNMLAVAFLRGADDEFFSQTTPIGEVSLAEADPEIRRKATQYARGRRADLVRGINNTTRKRVSGIIQRGIRDGKSYPSIAKELQDSFQEMRATRPGVRSRARLIAQTEVREAYAAGADAAIDDLAAASGVAYEKKWITRKDNRVTFLCRVNGSVGWIKKAESFPSGHMRPLRFPGCRCVPQYRVQRRRPIPPTQAQTARIRKPRARLRARIIT